MRKTLSLSVVLMLVLLMVVPASAQFSSGFLDFIKANANDTATGLYLFNGRIALNGPVHASQEFQIYNFSNSDTYLKLLNDEVGRVPIMAWELFTGLDMSVRLTTDSTLAIRDESNTTIISFKDGTRDVVIPNGDLTVNNDIIVSGTVDGIDVSKLDTTLMGYPIDTVTYDNIADGEILKYISGEWHPANVLLNEIGDPGGNATIAMGAQSIVWSFNSPASNGFEINMGGAFSNHALHVHQTGGNPGASILAHFEADDPDVLPLEVVTNGTRATVATFRGARVDVDSLDADGEVRTGALDVTGDITVSGTVDGVDVAALNTGVATDSADWSDAHDHSVNNTQAHTDYLRNDIADVALGIMTFSEGIVIPAPKIIRLGTYEISNNGVTGFTFNDDVGVTGDITVSGTVDGVDVAALAAEIDTLHFIFAILNPNATYDTDVRFCFKPVLASAITITRIDVTCDADPTTEPAMSLKYADAFIGLANAVTIDVITTTAGVTEITSGFDNASVPTGKALYFESLADPEAALKSITVDMAYTVD